MLRIPHPRIARLQLTWLTVLLAGFLTANAAFAQTASVPYAWHSVTIVAGGYVPGIIFSPKEPGLIYCRTDIGGAYRWDAAAKQWTPLTDAFGPPQANFLGCESIAPDPVDPNKVYIAAGMYSRSRAAILRSSDRGKTFQVAAVPFAMGGNENGRGIGERLTIDPNDTNILYFGSRHDGLWKSADGAVTWQKVDSFPMPAGDNTGAGVGFVIFDPRGATPGQPANSLYVGVAEQAGAHLFHSADAGKTWTAVPGQPLDLLPQHAALDAAGTLYLTYSDAIGPNGIARGAVEKFATPGGPWTDITPPSVVGGGFSGLSLDPQHPGTLVVSTLDHWNPGDDIFRTTDGGQTWRPLRATASLDPALSPYLYWGKPAPRFGWWMTALAIDPFDSDHVLYGTGATIWGTQDFTDVDHDAPTHWSVAARGMEETAVLDLASPPAGPHLISAVGDIGGFRHDDLAVSPPGGMSHDPIFTNTYSLDFAELKPSVVVRSGTGGNNNSQPLFSYSDDGGATWQPLSVPPAPARGGRGGFGGGRATLIVSADGATFLCTQGAPAISNDRGQTWTTCQGLRAGLRPIADRANPKKFYAYDAANAQMLVSADGGATFAAQAATGLPTGNGGGRGGFGGGGARLLATPGHEGDLWLLSNRHLLHSSDGGATFAPISPDATIYAIGFGCAPPGKTFPALYMTGNVGTQPGIFRSDDAGTTWVRINDDQHQYGNYPTVVIGDPRVYGRVYIGMNGRGILYADPASASSQ
jgi:xyloglucan-specific exo-beta-1,4-glucanase